MEQHVGDDEAEHGVAEELERLVVDDAARGVLVRARPVRQRVLEQAEVAELVADALLERPERLAEPPDFGGGRLVEVAGDQLARRARPIALGTLTRNSVWPNRIGKHRRRQRRRRRSTRCRARRAGRGRPRPRSTSACGRSRRAARRVRSALIARLRGRVVPDLEHDHRHVVVRLGVADERADLADARARGCPAASRSMMRRPRPARAPRRRTARRPRPSPR